MKVVKEVDFGMYLDGGEEGEVLLPARYVPEGCKVGDVIEITIGTRTVKVRVLAVPEYAGKQEAALLYSEISDI